MNVHVDECSVYSLLSILIPVHSCKPDWEWGVHARLFKLWNHTWSPRSTSTHYIAVWREAINKWLQVDYNTNKYMLNNNDTTTTVTFPQLDKKDGASIGPQTS